MGSLSERSATGSIYLHQRQLALPLKLDIFLSIWQHGKVCAFADFFFFFQVNERDS